MSTPGHKYFLLETKKWVSAEDLKVGVKVLLSSRKRAIIKEIQVEQVSEPETTYNFEVADFHTYYVGNGIGFIIGLAANIFIDWGVGNWISEWIDSIAI